MQHMIITIKYTKAFAKEGDLLKYPMGKVGISYHTEDFKKRRKKSVELAVVLLTHAVPNR